MSYDPEYDPTGIEAGEDANRLPWIALDGVDSVAFKPLRASIESGLFSVILKIEAGKMLPPTTYFSGLDMLLLSGHSNSPLFGDGLSKRTSVPIEIADVVERWGGSGTTGCEHELSLDAAISDGSCASYLRNSASRSQFPKADFGDFLCSSLGKITQLYMSATQRGFQARRQTTSSKKPSHPPTH